MGWEGSRQSSLPALGGLYGGGRPGGRDVNASKTHMMGRSSEQVTSPQVVTDLLATWPWCPLGMGIGVHPCSEYQQHASANSQPHQLPGLAQSQ